MYEYEFSVLMVIALGLIVGGGAGLLIAWAAGKSQPSWSAMTPSEKKISLVLVIACSLLSIASLAWYSLLR